MPAKADKLVKARILSLLLVLGLAQPGVMADAAKPQGSVDQQISALEDKLFEHNYPHEDEAARLTRLEKFVFGDSQSGTIPSRLSRVENSIAENTPKVAEATTSQSPPQLPSNTSTGSQSTASNDSQNAPASSVFDYSSYPRVTAIEKQLLGATYVHDSLSDRVARLETKAFGKASTSDDLGDRVDALDRYAHRHDLYRERDSNQQIASNQLASNQHFVPDTTDGDAPAPVHTNPFAPGNQLASGAAQRTTIMENSVFGRSFPDRPLNERVQRLEKRMVPYEHNLDKKSLPNRVDQLWSILSAANNLNSSPLAPNNRNNVIGANPAGQSNAKATADETDSSDDEAQDDSKDARQQNQEAGGRKSWLHKLSKALGAGAVNGTNTTNGNAIYPGSNYGTLGGPGTFWMPRF
jgi:hypothetical protein